MSTAPRIRIELAPDDWGVVRAVLVHEITGGEAWVEGEREAGRGSPLAEATLARLGRIRTRIAAALARWLARQEAKDDG